MKLNIYKISLWVLMCLLIQPVLAQNEKVKTVSKTFSASSVRKLQVNNKFGKVQINTIGTSQIKVDVRIEVETNSSEKTQKVLDNIIIDIDESGGVVSFKTIIDNDGMKYKGTRTMDIDYTIEIPASLDIDITNRFGDVYLGDFSGQLKMDVEHGDLRTEKMIGQKEKMIKVSFGDADIEKLELGSLNISHSEIELKAAGAIVLKNSFSDVELGEIGNLEITNQHGDVKIKSVANIKGKQSFGDVYIDLLTGNITFTKSHGDLKVKQVASSCKQIEINSSFGDTALNGVSNCDFDIQVTFGGMRTDKQASFTKKEEKMNSNKYLGKLGSGGTNIKVVGSHGDVILK